MNTMKTLKVAKAYEIVTAQSGFAATHLIRAKNKKTALETVSKLDSMRVVYSVEVPTETICDNDTL